MADKVFCPTLTAAFQKIVPCQEARCAKWVGDCCSDARAVELEAFCNWLAVHLMGEEADAV